MSTQRQKPEDIIENSPHGRDAKRDAEGSTDERQNRNRQRGPLPGEDENNPDDRTDSKDR